jgi:hypothetical protein
LEIPGGAVSDVALIFIKGKVSIDKRRVRAKHIYNCKISCHRSSLIWVAGNTMSLSNLEMIEKLKLAALRRCEERIESARTQGRSYVSQTPQFGVSALLKSRHGL